MMINKLKWVAVGSILIGSAVGGFRAFAQPEPPASVVPDESFRAKLADGTTVEVVGISTSPSGPKTWWAPDGSPLAEPPADTIEHSIGHADTETRTILVRVSGLPKGATFKWLPVDSRSYSGGRPTKGGGRAPELEYYMASFEKGRESCEVRVRVASGPWEAQGAHAGTGGYSFYKNGHKFYFGKARPHKGGTAIAVAHNIVGQDNRLVAIDLEGESHRATYSSGGGGEVLSLLDAEFPLPPEQIREYRVESRPFEEVEIKAIRLRPRD